MAKVVKVLASSVIAAGSCLPGGSTDVMAQDGQSVTIIGSAGGGGSMGLDLGTFGYSGGSQPEGEASYMWTLYDGKTLGQIAKGLLDKFEKPCVLPNESPSVYANRAMLACTKHVADQLPPIATLANRVIAAQMACQSLHADFAMTAIEPTAEQKCRG